MMPVSGLPGGRPEGATATSSSFIWAIEFSRRSLYRSWTLGRKLLGIFPQKFRTRVHASARGVRQWQRAAQWQGTVVMATIGTIRRTTGVVQDAIPFPAALIMAGTPPRRVVVPDGGGGGGDDW
eukprot:scaffold11457_cov124-Isochrysis_galbana.AAC.2